jgi:cell division protease FtsH
MSGRTWYVILAVAFCVYLYIYVINRTGPPAGGIPIQLTYSHLVSEINANNVKSLDLDQNSQTASGRLRQPIKQKGHTYHLYQVQLLDNFFQPVAKLAENESTPPAITIHPTTTPAWEDIFGIIIPILPFVFLIGLIFFMSRVARQQSAGVFGFGQGRGKLYTEDRPETTFGDVAGVDAAKSELSEVVDFLREPAKYHKLGARIPKGVLLVGGPGTGKTLLARAVAGEANVPFLAISATEFVELFVGVGASRVRDLFTRAKAVSPSIIFIDEIDAIGGSRGARSPVSGGGNDEREQTLNQMLVSMDGFEPNDAVIVLAATNRPDILDHALLRPGRFDREVIVDPPDRKGREAILKIHSRNIPLAQEVDLGDLARMTPGMSGADLANLCNEAALSAARKQKSQVDRSDFSYALDRVTLGLEGSPLMNEEERRTVAYHEAGHAVTAFMLPNVDPVSRITITPRGRSLGVTQFLPVDDRRNYRRDYLVNRMAVGMGGRAAEEIAFDDITSGAQNDFQVVTNVARTMVTQLGMDPEIGPAYLGGSGDDMLGGRYGGWEPKEYSDTTAARIDTSVLRLVEEAHQKALGILTTNRRALDAVADALLHEESLDREQFTRIVNANLPPGVAPMPVPTGEPTPTGEAPARTT